MRHQLSLAARVQVTIGLYALESWLAREDREMSFFQVKSSYWRLRAEETRAIADTVTTNVHAYGIMLRIADEYERLAVHRSNSFRISRTRFQARATFAG